MQESSYSSFNVKFTVHVDSHHILHHFWRKNLIVYLLWKFLNIKLNNLELFGTHREPLYSIIWVLTRNSRE
jgi:hypothetical protein